MTTLAAVVRVSHMGARKVGADDFRADEEQTAKIRDYAAALGADVVMLPPELDTSGGAPIERRPSLLAAIEGVEAGEFDGIIVANLKRLTRSRSGHIIWERVEAAGGRVYCARERVDTSTAQGRKMRDYAIADAVEEREEHGEQHAERRRVTVERGIWRQRQTPLGYRKGEKPNRHLIADERADDVRWAFQARATGTPIVQIANRLGMTPSGVRALLKNRVYLGELRDGEHVKLSAHDALIDRDTFEAAQISTPRPPRSVADGPALLAGIVRCAGCGHVMTRRQTKSLVYGCPVNHSGERCPEPASITCSSLDSYVESIALVELERLSVTASEGAGVERAQAVFEDAEAELAAFLDVASARDAGFAAGVAKRRDAIDVARDALRVQLAQRPMLPALKSGADAWELLDARERNHLLRSLLAVVVVKRCGRGRRVPVEDRVRVVAYGAEIALPQRSGSEAIGIVPIALPDIDTEGVLRAPAGE